MQVRAFRLGLASYAIDPAFPLGLEIQECWFSDFLVAVKICKEASDRLSFTVKCTQKEDLSVLLSKSAAWFDVKYWY